MVAWSVKPVISQLEDTAFNRLKKEFVETYKYIHTVEENKTIKALIEILCSSAHINIITRDELSAIVDSIFSVQMKDSHWLRRYMDNLVALLPTNDAKKQLGYSGRAASYYDRAHNKLPQKLDELLKNGKTLSEVDVLDVLRDQVQFVFALNNEWMKVGFQAKQISNISLQLEGHENAFRIWYHIGAKAAAPKPVVIGGIKIAPIVIPTLFPPANEFQNNDRQLAILFTRILLCEALEQDK